MSRYRFASFILIALTGRIVWTGAYMGLGYSVGGNLDSATGFLANVTGLLVSLLVVWGSATVIILSPPRRSQRAPP